MLRFVWEGTDSDAALTRQGISVLFSLEPWIFFSVLKDRHGKSNDEREVFLSIA